MESRAATFAGLGLVGTGGVVLTAAMMGWFGGDELPPEEHSPVVAASQHTPSSASTPSDQGSESSTASTASSSSTRSTVKSASPSSASPSTSRTPSPTSVEPAPSPTSEPAPRATSAEPTTDEPTVEPTTQPTTATPRAPGTKSPTAAPEPTTPAPVAPPTTETPSPTPEPRPTTPSTTPAPTTQDPGHAKPGDPVGRPARLTIPSIGFDREVSEVGLTSKGTLNPPPGITGWYGKTVAPGEDGISVIAGHVTYGPPDVFYELPNIQPGAEFTTTDADGRVRAWKVDLVEHIDKVALSRDQRIWGTSSTPKLALVTCDPDTPRTNGHSAVNVFVLASPA